MLQLLLLISKGSGAGTTASVSSNQSTVIRLGDPSLVASNTKTLV